MLVSLIFGAVVAALVQGTHSYEDCKKIKFENKGCDIAKVLNKAEK